jgi:uncharacterized membrane protein
MPFQHFGHGGGSHTLTWLLVVGIFLLVAAVVFLALRYAAQPVAPVPPGSASAAAQDLLTVIARRYANGEISREDYLRINADLGGPPVPNAEPPPPE